VSLPRFGANTPPATPARRWALLTVAAVFLSSCIQDDGSRFNPADLVIPSISDDDESELGMEFDRELRRVIPVIDDPVVTDFIQALGQAVVSEIEPQPFLYRFRVIDDPSLNAFAVPGGYVYFHSGTIANATSIHELAAVMGHEIAHVKQHHYARMRKKSQIPDILVSLAGMAAAVAAEEPGLMVAAQAANVAMKLRYSREYEAEADQYGTVFMARAGYEPMRGLRFFERILAIEEQRPEEIPPYLFSHPDVADRIESIEIAADRLEPGRPPEPDLVEALPIVQARLARLAAANRTSLPSSAPSGDRASPDPALAEASALADAGDIDAALERLARAEKTNPEDPRIPYRIGELQFAAGRYAAASESYRRTAALDASRAKVFFKLGMAYREIGDRPSAVYAFEQAEVRAGPTSRMRERARWEVFKLTFAILIESGFADGGKKGDTPVGTSRESFDASDRRMAWWGRVNPRFRAYVERFVVRWSDPSGRVVQEEYADEYGRTRVGSLVELDTDPAIGIWSADLLLDGERVERFEVAVTGRDG